MRVEETVSNIIMSFEILTQRNNTIFNMQEFTIIIYFNVIINGVTLSSSSSSSS